MRSDDRLIGLPPAIPSARRPARRPGPTDDRDRRRAKIVCTLGPATSSDEQVARLVEAGMDIARLNFSHGDRADHKRVYHAVRSRGRQLRSGRRHPRRPAGPEDPAGPVRRRSGQLADRGERPDHRRRRGRHPRPGLHHLQGAGRRRPPRGPAAGRRRPGRAHRHRGRRHRRVLPGGRGRHRLGQQGHLAARDERLGAGDVREGHRRPGVRARPDRRLHRAVVRPLPRRTSSWSTRSWTRPASGCR